MPNIKLSDILRQAEELIGDSIDFAVARDWCNECSNKFLNPVANLEGYSEILTTPGVAQYDLPDDIYEYKLILAMLNNTKLYPVSIGTNNLSVDQYKLWDNKIEIAKIHEQATVKLWYNKTINLLVNAGDEPNIPNYFRHIYTYYICMKFQQFDEELELKRDYETEFREAVRDFANERSKRMNRMLTKQWEVRRW